MKQLSYHFYGNYFTQALLLTAAHVRDAADRIAAFANADVVRAARSTFGALLRPLRGEAADMARHPQARFVLEVIIDRCGLGEVARLAEELGDSFADIVAHKSGSKLLQRLVTRMVCMHFSCMNWSAVSQRAAGSSSNPCKLFQAALIPYECGINGR